MITSTGRDVRRYPRAPVVPTDPLRGAVRDRRDRCGGHCPQVMRAWPSGAVAELVDAWDLKSQALRVRVRFPPAPPAFLLARTGRCTDQGVRARVALAAMAATNMGHNG